MSNCNRYGLSRNIPAKVKIAVRQNSRFGCILCRSAIYTYEHIDPPFIDAKCHDPSRIALLCPTCHVLVTKGRIPKNYVSDKYNLIQNTYSVKRPSDQEFFTHYGNDLSIKLGPSEFKEFRSIININGIDVLSYQKSSESDGYSVSGVFYDNQGKELFRIVNNEWIGPIDVWDVEQVGCRLTIKNAPDRVVFDAVKNNEKSELHILKLDMYFPPFHIFIDSGRLIIGQFGENKKESFYFGIDGEFNHGDCAIYLDSNKTMQLKPSEVKMVGGKGAWIDGSGIWIGFGAKKMSPRHIQYFNNGCETGVRNTIKKSIIPRENQNYFVVGVLEVRVIEHPLWTEEEFYINSQRLTCKPFSWGIIYEVDGQSIELFHISRAEPEDLALNPGFIGFYADDVLSQEWSDRVFEVEVEDNRKSEPYILRVKRADIGNRRIIHTLNPVTGKPFHPQEFSGTCPWKE